VVEPKAGDCGLFLAHLRDNVAQGDEKLFRWVVGWLADIVQQPARKCGTSLVLRGKQGTGKTIIGKTMRRLLGEHYTIVTKDTHITGQFNAHLAKCLLLHADEAFWAGDKQAAGTLKDLATGDVHMIEYKYHDAIAIDNYIRLLISSNADWVVPAGMEERRFATVTVGDAYRENHEYFGAIERQLDDGGAEALLYSLLNFDLSQVDISVIPATEGLLEQKIQSLDPIKGWWLTTLQSGRLPAGCSAANTCPKAALYQRYLDHSSMTRARGERSIATQFGMQWRKLLPLSPGGKANLGTFSDGYYMHQFGPMKFGTVYQLPSLADCRRYFEELIGQPIIQEVDVPDLPEGSELALDEDSGGEDDWTIDDLPFREETGGGVPD
jgi:hypothetical protein